MLNTYPDREGIETTDMAAHGFAIRVEYLPRPRGD